MTTQALFDDSANNTYKRIQLGKGLAIKLLGGLGKKVYKSHSLERKELPDRVDVSSLEDYKSFKQVDNEGKYLFDFVTISVCNVRKQMIEWLSPYFN